MKKFLLLIFFFLYSLNSTAHMAHYNKYNKIEMEILKDGEVIGYNYYFFKKDKNETIVTNQRHYEQLKNTLNELELVIEGLNNGLSGDLLAINIKQSLFYLGLITGEVSTDDLLSNIFGKFCIGK